MRTLIALASTLAILAVAACGSSDDDRSDPPPTELHQVVVLKSGAYKDRWDGIAVRGAHLYLSAGGNIHIFEIRDGQDATEVGMFTTQGASGLVVRGDRLYYVDANGVNVADISDSAAIKPLSTIKDLELGPVALNAIKDSPLQTVVPSTSLGPANEVVLFDLLHPENPEQVSRFFATNAVTSLAIDGDTLYVGTDLPPDGFVEVWDVSNWDAPTRIGTTPQTRCGLLFPVGNGVAFCGQGGNDGKARPVLDARVPSMPTFPVVRTDADLPGTTWFGVTLFLRVGSYVYVKGTNQGDIIPYDIKDPLHPQVRGFSAATQLGGAFNTTHAMVADDRFVYTLHDEGATILQRRDH